MGWAYKLQANVELILIVEDLIKPLDIAYHTKNYEYYAELTVSKSKDEIFTLTLLNLQRIFYVHNLRRYRYPFVCTVNTKNYPTGKFSTMYLYTKTEPIALQAQSFSLDNIPIIDWEEQHKIWATTKLLEMTE